GGDRSIERTGRTDRPTVPQRILLDAHDARAPIAVGPHIRRSLPGTRGKVLDHALGLGRVVVAARAARATNALAAHAEVYFVPGLRHAQKGRQRVGVDVVVSVRAVLVAVPNRLLLELVAGPVAVVVKNRIARGKAVVVGYECIELRREFVFVAARV